MLDKERTYAARDMLRKTIRMHDFLMEIGIAPSRSYDNKHVYKCPIHAGDNSPSFYVYQPEDGHDNFYCYGCKKWGDVVDLKSFIDRIPVNESCAILCDKYKLNSFAIASENDLLENEIDSWERMEEKKEDIDIGALCFSVSRIFRNMCKSGKISIEPRSEGDCDVLDLMKYFDRAVRVKDYDKARALYEKMQGKLVHA